MSESVKSGWLNCANIDVISIHAYGVGDFSTNINTCVNQAKAADKKLIFQGNNLPLVLRLHISH